MKDNIIPVLAEARLFINSLCRAYGQDTALKIVLWVVAEEVHGHDEWQVPRVRRAATEMVRACKGDTGPANPNFWEDN